MSRPPYSEIVENLPSVTPFVGPETIERQQGKPFRVRIGANESAFGVSPRAAAAMSEAARGVAWYCDPEGYELRTELAAMHGVDIENVTLGAGIDDLLGLIVRMYMDPGDAVAASLGCYPTFVYHVDGFGGRLETVPYRNDRNDLTALTDLAAKQKASILYLSNPDNPTGSYYGSNAISDLLDRVPPDCLFILDEAYLDFVPPDTILPIDVEDPRLIRVRTFSKAHGMAGARVGYAIAHRDVIRTFDKVRLHFGVSLVAQAGALASLRDPEFVASVVKAVEAGRENYRELAEDTGISSLPSQTNFVAFDFGTGERAGAVMNTLIERGVFLRKPAAPGLDRLVRVTVGTPGDRAVFSELFRDVMNGA
ncbi:MAG: aminotransferase class I/II-fold pyridoxal phosphate-dependent enzyme [Gemmatimonadetes bacterium]|nr:aminotransferase class I/II-fold pyridoxal phosphate-dependent enzyme [Gemmatimonadota bacterium]